MEDGTGLVQVNLREYGLPWLHYFFQEPVLRYYLSSRFYRRFARGVGAGLWMFIVRRIAERMEGTVGVESEVGLAA